MALARQEQLTVEELVINILILQQKLQVERKSDPVQFIKKAVITSMLFNLLVQGLVLTKGAPYFKDFSDYLIGYLKEFDPVIRPLYDKLNTLQKLMEGDVWQKGKMAKEIKPLFSKLKALGIKIAESCDEVRRDSAGGLEIRPKNGQIGGMLALHGGTEVLVLQACNGGIEGLTKKINQFILDYSKGYSLYLMRPKILGFFAGIGFVNSILVQQMSQLFFNKRDKVTSFQLLGCSQQQLQDLHSYFGNENNNVTRFNNVANTMLLVLMGMVVLYGIFIDLPPPLVISALSPLLLPLSEHLARFEYQQYRYRQTKSQLNILKEHLEKKLQKRTIHYLPGPSMLESTLEINAKDIRKDNIIRAFVYCLRHSGFICQEEKGKVHIFMTGDTQCFHASEKANEFWQWHEKTIQQFILYDELKKLFDKIQTTILLDAHPVNRLPIFRIFFKNDIKLNIITDENLQVMPVPDGHGYEILVLGKLSSNQFEGLNQLVTKTLESQSYHVQPQEKKSVTVSVAESRDTLFPTTLRDRVSRYTPALWSAVENKAEETLPRFRWESGLVFDRSKPKNSTPGLLPLIYNGRPYSIFIFCHQLETMLESVKEEGLRKKLQKHFQDPKEVRGQNEQGFVLEDGMLILKLLGKHGDVRLHPLAMETNNEGQLVFSYGDITFNAHKTLERGQIPKPTKSK